MHHQVYEKKMQRERNMGINRAKAYFGMKASLATKGKRLYIAISIQNNNNLYCVIISIITSCMFLLY